MIENGTLALGADDCGHGNNRLPKGTTVTLGGEGTTIHSGILQLGDGTTSCNQTIAGLKAQGVGGGPRRWRRRRKRRRRHVDVDAFGRHLGHVRRNLGGTGPIQNNLALHVNGSGTVELTQVSTYTGLTTIEGGSTLWIDGATSSTNVLTGGVNISNSSLVLHYYTAGDGTDLDSVIPTLLGNKIQNTGSGSLTWADNGYGQITITATLSAT